MRRLKDYWHHGATLLTYGLRACLTSCFARKNWRISISLIVHSWQSSWMCAGIAALCRRPAEPCSAPRARERRSQMMPTDSASIWLVSESSFQASNNSVDPQSRTASARHGIWRLESALLPPKATRGRRAAPPVCTLIRASSDRSGNDPTFWTIQRSNVFEPSNDCAIQPFNDRTDLTFQLHVPTSRANFRSSFRGSKPWRGILANPYG